MQRLFKDLSSENALQIAWTALSCTHPRYAGQFDPELIDEIFSNDVLELIQEYEVQFVTYAEVLNVSANIVTLSVRLTTELPIKINGVPLKLPSLVLINEANVLVVIVSGPSVICDSLHTSDHQKQKDSLSAKAVFEVATLDDCNVDVDFYAKNRWLQRRCVSIDHSIFQDHPSG